MSNPKVSIIMPVYGVEKYIENSIKSVLCQSYKNYEIILVDDESPDRSIVIAEETLRNTTVTYKIFHKKNGGQGSSRNYGLGHAEGDWLMFLDSDDILQPCALQNMIESTKLFPNCQIVFSNYLDVTIGNEFKPCEPYGEAILYNRVELQEAFMHRSRVVLAPGTLYEANWYRKCNLKFEETRFSEDILFVWDALLACENAIYIDKKLYNYLRHPQSVMTATKVDTLIKSYPFIKALEKKYVDSTKTSLLVKKFILPRWVFGILNTGTLLCSFKEYLCLCKELEGTKNFRRLLTYPSINIRIMSLIFLISKYCYYKLNKKRLKVKFRSRT